MRTAYLMGITALFAVAAACGSDDVSTQAGSTTSGTGAATTTGTGGDMTTSTTTGMGGSSQGGGGGGQGGAAMCPGFGDACTNCLSANCQATYCDCFNNQTCVTLVQCLQGCAPMDAACQQTCFTNNADGISDSVLLADCVDPVCNGPMECNGIGQMLGACEKCLFTNCPTDMNTCLANPECYAIVVCVQTTCAPGDQACQQNCALQHTGGLNDIQGVLNCASDQTLCQMDCN